MCLGVYCSKLDIPSHPNILSLPRSFGCFGGKFINCDDFQGPNLMSSVKVIISHLLIKCNHNDYIVDIIIMKANAICFQ